MRLLNISKQPTDPAWATDNAHALPFLRQLAAARPLGLEPAHGERLLRFLVSMAKQYRGQGAPWQSLLTAGYEALADGYDRYTKQRAQFTGTMEEYERRYSPSHWGSWWVRQGIVAAAQVYESGDLGVSE